jgi:cGMP-dependent protein kinase
MEFINGCELSTYLSQRKSMHLYNKEETQFYIASLLLIITYLNSKNIIHRDIKPDNIMINASGYITLIDFNTCREIKDLSSTLAGTPHYMAPEILIGKGYGLSVDYWSIGVLCFYLYFGYLPFGNGMNDPIEIYKDIIRGKISYPVKDEVSEFISGLVKKNVWERMCSFELLKRTRLFEVFNWNELIDLKVKPLFIPKQRINVEEVVRKGNCCLQKYSEFLNKEGKVKDMEGEESESGDEDSMEVYDVEWDRDF